MSYYTGKRVFLVGGSEGIGRETARALAQQGAHVVVAARREGPLQETVDHMRAAAASPNQKLDFVSLDVTDREAIRAAVPPVLDKLGGGLDVLVLNVGMARPGYFVDLDDDDIDAMLAVNYVGHVHVTRAFLDALRASPKADLCFVSSAFGFMSLPGYSAYSGSKYAIAGFAECLRMELASDGIRVTVFYPGTTQTPGLDAENARKPPAVWEVESASTFSKTHQPEDVAKTLLRSIERGRFENFPGLDVWFVYFMYKRFPGLSRTIADMEWRTAVKKVVAKGQTP